MRKPSLTIPLLVTAGVLLLLVPSVAHLYTDWLWFGELGFEQVFLRILGTRAGLGAVVFVFAFLVLELNLRIAQGTLRQRPITLYGLDGSRTITLNTGRLKPLLRVGAAVAALLLALYAASRWNVLLMAWHAVPFGITDPILGFDVAFFVFQLPLLQFLHGIIFATVLLAVASTVAVHALGQSLAIDPMRGLIVSHAARRHLSVLAAALLLLLAFHAWLGIPKLLITPSGIVHGASNVDVHARLPMQWALIVAALIGAALAAWQVTQTKYWPLLSAAGLCLAVVVLGNGYALLLQRFVVTPNEQVRETPYIEHSIAATRAGFALDRVVERDLSGEAALAAADIERNAATFDNIPLWNDQPLLETFGQIQEIRTYYDFASVDNDRYVIDGEYRQIMLSAREMNSASLPSASWINERLTFTHGYGLTLGPVNQVTPEGLPTLFIRDLPLVSTVNLKVDRPEIYFGELSNDHVFVRTATREFDYPKGNDNVFGTYAGKGGVPVGGPFRRTMLAARFGSTDTLFSPNLTADSRVLMYRRIAERVQRIAPFLTFDPDPYLAISGGRLVWIQDAYTTSSRYPYSTPSRGGVNYIRNSVKVTIDAYDGTVVFYRIDERDPVAATLARVFPVLFRPLAAMPEDLRGRLRYPQAIFALQAAMFTTFHMTQPTTFYNREDQWDVPVLEQGDRAERMVPYYTIMKLPGETSPEYIQMLPFTPHQKDNLAAWMVARSDGDNYGQLMVFEFPKQTVVFGPRQIAARISQDEVIAPQITLWNQQGSQVIQGTLLVIPVEESLVYIRPLYLRAAGGRIPELKRVIVAYRNQIVMEETLDGALGRLFPGARGAPQGGTAAAAAAAPATSLSATPASDLAIEARLRYQRAIEAQRAGNWSRYGEEIQRLGELLERMSAAAGRSSGR
ncbi:MAG: UPF0182 family protein [Gammaproteobacteria bacterium]|nr:UPF0182 family protein [Gammaproteobacteria bacterium]